MLLTIRNLPPHLESETIKALIKAACDVDDVLMGCLAQDNNGNKQIKIGVIDQSEADRVYKILNGFDIFGHQIWVDETGPEKNKIPKNVPDMVTPTAQILPAITPAFEVNNFNSFHAQKPFFACGDLQLNTTNQTAVEKVQYPTIYPLPYTERSSNETSYNSLFLKQPYYATQNTSVPTPQQSYNPNSFFDIKDNTTSFIEALNLKNANKINSSPSRHQRSPFPKRRSSSRKRRSSSRNRQSSSRRQRSRSKQRDLLSPKRRRSRTPKRRKSPIPKRRHSPTPRRRKSPISIRRQSPISIRRQSPVSKRKRSSTPKWRKSPIPVRQRSPATKRRKSPIPIIRRSRKSKRERSPILKRRRKPTPKPRRSITHEQQLLSPAKIKPSSFEERSSALPEISSPVFNELHEIENAYNSQFTWNNEQDTCNNVGVAAPSEQCSFIPGLKTTYFEEKRIESDSHSNNITNNEYHAQSNQYLINSSVITQEQVAHTHNMTAKVNQNSYVAEAQALYQDVTTNNIPRLSSFGFNTDTNLIGNDDPAVARNLVWEHEISPNIDHVNKNIKDVAFNSNSNAHLSYQQIHNNLFPSKKDFELPIDFGLTSIKEPYSQSIPKQVNFTDSYQSTIFDHSNIVDPSIESISHLKSIKTNIPFSNKFHKVPVKNPNLTVINTKNSKTLETSNINQPNILSPWEQGEKITTSIAPLYDHKIGQNPCWTIDVKKIKNVNTTNYQEIDLELHERTLNYIFTRDLNTMVEAAGKLAHQIVTRVNNSLDTNKVKKYVKTALIHIIYARLLILKHDVCNVTVEWLQDIYRDNFLVSDDEHLYNVALKHALTDICYAKRKGKLLNEMGKNHIHQGPVLRLAADVSTPIKLLQDIDSVPWQDRFPSLKNIDKMSLRVVANPFVPDKIALMKFLKLYDVLFLRQGRGFNGTTVVCRTVRYRMYLLQLGTIEIDKSQVTFLPLKYRKRKKVKQNYAQKINDTADNQHEEVFKNERNETILNDDQQETQSYVNNINDKNYCSCSDVINSKSEKTTQKNPQSDNNENLKSEKAIEDNAQSENNENFISEKAIEENVHIENNENFISEKAIEENLHIENNENSISKKAIEANLHSNNKENLKTEKATEENAQSENNFTCDPKQNISEFKEIEINHLVISDVVHVLDKSEQITDETIEIGDLNPDNDNYCNKINENEQINNSERELDNDITEMKIECIESSNCKPEVDEPKRVDNSEDKILGKEKIELEPLETEITKDTEDIAVYEQSAEIDNAILSWNPETELDECCSVDDLLKGLDEIDSEIKENVQLEIGDYTSDFEPDDTMIEYEDDDCINYD